MRLSTLVPALLLLGPPLAGQARLPDVQERRLANGARILLVERPGSGAFHARLFFRGGRSEAGGRALDLVARSVFHRLDPQDLEAAAGLEALLDKEDGTLEALRRERLVRQRTGTVTGGLEQELTYVHLGLLNEVKGLLPDPGDPDLLEALGAVRRGLRVEADFIEASLDLPAPALGRWIRLEAARLSHLRLSSLPLLRNRPVPKEPRDLRQLVGAAFPGRQEGPDREEGVDEALGWREARALAQRLFSPERLVLVLVGDLRAEQAFPVLEQALGALRSPEVAPAREAPPQDLPEAPGSRRLQVVQPGPPRLLAGWRVPPMDHPDTAVLRMLAAALGEGRSARLPRALVDTGLARGCRVRMGVPGGRRAGLLAVELTPAEGHSLRELALALDGEALRLQQEPMGREEFTRLLRWAEVDQLQREADPSALAQTLGEAACGAGDWRTAFPLAGHALRPEDLQRAARTYLVPGQFTEVQLEPDPLEDSQDPLDRRLVEALRRLASTRIPEPAKADELVRQSLRQLKMLSREDREAALKLLRPPEVRR